MINFREKRRGYLWPGRFSSFPLDENYLYAGILYERNPVIAGIVKKEQDYEFSSARAHVYKTKDILLCNNFVTEEIKDWSAFLSDEDNEHDIKLFEKHTSVGRPLGKEGFVEKLEKLMCRILKPQKPRRKTRNK